MKAVVLALLFLISSVAYADSYGPFEFRSEYDPKYQRPPYRTGRSCADSFAKLKKPSVSDLKTQAPQFARLVLGRLIEAELRSRPGSKREDVEKRITLSKSLCVGASLYMIQELDKLGVKLDLTTVQTRDYIGPIEASHVYLVEQDYFGDGKPLIIDPTIRQFFTRFMSAEEIEASIPEIFIGSPAEFKTLFETHFRTEMKRWDTEKVIRFYLNTYVHPKLFS